MACGRFRDSNAGMKSFMKMLFCVLRNTVCRRSAHHAGGAPYVGRSIVVGTDQNLHRTILTRLDVFSEVFVLTTTGMRFDGSLLTMSSPLLLAELQTKCKTTDTLVIRLISTPIMLVLDVVLIIIMCWAWWIALSRDSGSPHSPKTCTIRVNGVQSVSVWEWIMGIGLHREGRDMSQPTFWEDKIAPINIYHFILI